MWVLASATAKVGATNSNKDICEIIYSQTTQDEDGEDEVETQTSKHQRTSFDGKLQTDNQWYANIKGEIVADLSGLNRTEPEETDITARVSS